MKPVVDRIEASYRDRLHVIRLNIQEDDGRAAARRLGAEFTPTFILFDADGGEIWRRVGSINVAELSRFLA